MALWDLVVTELVLILYMGVLVFSHRSTEPVDCTELTFDTSTKGFRGKLMKFIFIINLQCYFELCSRNGYRVVDRYTLETALVGQVWLLAQHKR